MKRPISHKSLLSYAEFDGYPVYGFEAFYQQGLSCYRWSLPKIWRKQAFQHQADLWKLNHGKVAMWQIRAFIYGSMGWSIDSLVPKAVADESYWPLPPDPSWDTLICVYPYGFWELDFAHRVSRRFISEDSGFIDLPPVIRDGLTPDWFLQMGFIIIHMQGTELVRVGPRKKPKLSLI
jgi:hypothetical protein